MSSKRNYNLCRQMQFLICRREKNSSWASYKLNTNTGAKFRHLNTNKVKTKNIYVDRSILIMESRASESVNSLYPAIKQELIHTLLIEYIWRYPLRSLTVITQEAEILVANTARLFRHLASCSLLRYHRFFYSHTHN